MKKNIFNVLESMDITDATLDSRLEYDLGMDSQEIVCFMEDVQKAYNVHLQDGDFKRSMTIADCLKVVLRKQTGIPSRADTFKESLQVDTVINAPIAAVYDGLYDLSKWESQLPHINEIDIKYNDGEFQEFFMGVEGADGNPLRVRSIRRCVDNHITFFQPEPPKFLKYHCGGWLFMAIDEDRTYVSTYHHWTLSDDAEQLHPSDERGTTFEKISNLLKEHAQFALDCWKKNKEVAA